jgi:ABC-type glycerol-3-phosphate transport system permease component
MSSPLLSRWRRLKPHLASYGGLAPFLAFALFPFYWGLITSLKADANLYDLKANPFWFASTDRTTGKPYHKDIIVPASLTEGVMHWSIVPGAHTTRSDSEQNPKPIAFIGEQPIVSPVDGTLSERSVAEGQIAHPNDVIGVIRVASPTLTHYRYLKSTPFYRWMKVSLVTGSVVVLITLLLAVPAAYALARLSFPGNRSIGIAIFLTYLIPPTILFIPFSQFVGALHIDNTIWSLILTYPTFTVPFCTWLLMGFFRSVPKEI